MLQHYSCVRFHHVLLFPIVNSMSLTFSNVVETRWIRQQAYYYCQLPSSNSSAVTILSRKGARRQLLNENEIAESLEDRGYRVLVRNFENQSYCDQVHVMQVSRGVISNHGAQLVNLLFLQPGSFVIEIFNPLFYLDMYEGLARQAEVHYVALRNATIVNMPGEKVRRFWYHPYVHCDVVVDPLTIVHLVESLVFHAC